MTVAGYQTIEELSSSEWFTLQRGKSLKDGQPVLLKVPGRLPPRAAEAELFKREFELLRNLAVPGVARAIELIRNDETCCLVLKGSSGRPLREHLVYRPRLESFFRLAPPLCGVLVELHRQNLICRSLSPQSILVDPATAEVTLIDLSLASRDSGESLVPLVPLLLHSVRSLLPYISPEQTGRMNRTTDHRTDFYSLGVIFYAMLTGAPPFDSGDILELIHGHIAKIPRPPAEVDRTVPEPLSQIVMKLLAKTPEERYQSALGIKSDLEHCASEWSGHTSIAAFPLGQRDISDRFLIPEKLYGREAEAEALLRAFDRTCQGPTAMMLVAGYSGIGKTSLIQELYKPIACQRGHFVTGKFDQVVRNIPFGALIQAFRGLVLQLLTQSEEHLAVWRTRLLQALGANSAVLAEVIPEIELIIGKQPPVPVLGPAEALNRFQLVIQNFVGALARQEYPLVMFLDDLQWADSATLSLLDPLLTNQDIRFLFLMGAYRDNEVDASHPLTRTLKNVESAGARLHRVFLGPLQRPDLTLFIQDTLHSQLSEAESLARLVMEKTGGNPFFVIQFLKALRQEGLLEFDYQRGCWTCRMEDIRRAGMTDNVIDLMTRKIQRLSAESQHTLTLAACIGNPFDLNTLAIVSQQPLKAVADGVRETVEEGLVLPSAAAYEDFSSQAPHPVALTAPSYVFLHDRVQQAAYALVPNKDKPRVHLAVGRLLLEGSAPAADEKVFDVVHHLNLGAGLITDPGEHLGLIRLNLSAGRKAKTSAAFQAALSYFKTGMTLSTEDQWDCDYGLMFALHMERAECEYLCGHFEEADRYCDLLLERARTRLEKAQVYSLRVIQSENMTRYAAAVEWGQAGLANFGISFPISPEGKQAVLEEELSKIHALMKGRAIESLIDLPEMEDPGQRMVMKLLTLIWSPTYIAGDLVLTRLLSATMVRFSLAYGNTEESAYGYATHTITIGPIRGDYGSAYEWGKLALRVNERFNDPKQRARVHQQFHAHANLWRRPFQTCIPHAREAWRSGLEAGDFTYAGYGAFTETWNTMLINSDLDAFVRDCSSTLAMLEKVKMTGLVAAQKVFQNWARALQGLTSGELSLSDPNFDEEAYTEAYGTNPFFMTFLHVLKLHLCIIFGEFEQARETAQRARAFVDNFVGTIWPVLLDFFNGLALLATYPQETDAGRRSCLNEITRIRESLGPLAESCPENFRCAALLLTGGLENIHGRTLEAIQAYEQAIQVSRETENLQNEALACDLFGQFWNQRGNSEVASLYLVKARRLYSEWGAVAKVKHLLEKHSSLLAEQPASDDSRSGATVAIGGTVSSRLDAQRATVSLDIATVTKAARALAVEIELKELLGKLIKIAIENAGAQRGFFLEENENQLVIQAEGSADQEVVSVLRALPLQSSDKLSKAVVHYVQKTGESVVLGDAVSDDRFSGDLYIATTRPKSILCVPVVHQGKFSGILYLENNLAANAFTAERIEVMRILSSQAAISLENARLYEEMKQEAELRRKAEEVLRDIVEGTASVTGSDFFYSLVRHLASALEVRYAFVTECRDSVQAHTLAFWKGDSFAENVVYDLAGTPCQSVMRGSLCHYPDRLAALFPLDKELAALRAESYVGIPILDASGEIIGHLAVMDDKPMRETAPGLPVMKVFAARAGAEMERLRAEQGLRTALAEVETLKDRLHAENIYLQEEIRREHNFEEIVGSSPALLRLLREVEQVAPTHATVLIYGETGTGKELIARAVHDRSPRRERPLVKVNCGAISAGLVESELFGHVKGAFTGAIDNRTGRFELADGGTLFLDEVGELPPETQVKLLRVLQEQEFEPVGSSRSVRVDVRIIAASNHDLAEAVSAGRFRADLFYRLNVFPLTVPPLRARRSDIPLLVTFFLSRFSKKVAKTVDSVFQETMDRLVNYSWPGNVRELQNIIERGVVLSPGSVLTLDRNLLPDMASAESLAARADAHAPAILNASRPPSSPSAPREPSSLEEVERRHILEVLKKTAWVIEGPKGAAKILSLHPNTLRSRMKKLGIQRSSHQIS